MIILSFLEIQISIIFECRLLLRNIFTKRLELGLISAKDIAIYLNQLTKRAVWNQMLSRWIFNCIRVHLLYLFTLFNHLIYILFAIY
jgi:hypothetical protein